MMKVDEAVFDFKRCMSLLDLCAVCHLYSVDSELSICTFCSPETMRLLWVQLMDGNPEAPIIQNGFF